MYRTLYINFCDRNSHIPMVVNVDHMFWCLGHLLCVHKSLYVRNKWDVTHVGTGTVVSDRQADVQEGKSSYDTPREAAVAATKCFYRNASSIDERVNHVRILFGAVPYSVEDLVTYSVL